MKGFLKNTNNNSKASNIHITISKTDSVGSGLGINDEKDNSPEKNITFLKLYAPSNRASKQTNKWNGFSGKNLEIHNFSRGF